MVEREPSAAAERGGPPYAASPEADPGRLRPGLWASRQGALADDVDAICCAGVTGGAVVVVVVDNCHPAPLRTEQAPFAHPAPRQRSHGPSAFKLATIRRGDANPTRWIKTTHYDGQKLRHWLRRFTHLYRIHITVRRNASNRGQLSLTA